MVHLDLDQGAKFQQRLHSNFLTEPSRVAHLKTNNRTKLYSLCHEGSLASGCHNGTSLVIPAEGAGTLKLLPVCQHCLNLTVFLRCGAIVIMVQIASIVT